MYYSTSGNFFTAKSYYDSGLNVIPLKLDGTKSPVIRFRRYIEWRYPWFQARSHFGIHHSTCGIGIICGITSGNLEVLDFDYDSPRVYPTWEMLVDAALLSRLPIVETPKGGRHVYYRCPIIEVGTKWAMTEDKQQTIIETRGTGHYVVAPGSPPECHPLRKPYKVLQGALTGIPEITPNERLQLLESARRFDRRREVETSPREIIPKPMQRASAPSVPSNSLLDSQLREIFGGDLGEMMPLDERPGDEFNRDATWEDVLIPHGWEALRTRGNVTYWRRPGKNDPGVSATTGHSEANTLHVFSTNAHPFEAGESYNKFAAYTILNHSGDFHEAAKSLSEMR